MNAADQRIGDLGDILHKQLAPLCDADSLLAGIVALAGDEHPAIACLARLARQHLDAVHADVDALWLRVGAERRGAA